MHQRIVNLNEESNLLYISKTDIDNEFNTNEQSHSNLELLLITNGNGNILTTNKTIQLSKGSFIIINPNSNHYETTKGLEFFAIGIKNTNIYLKQNYIENIISFNLSSEDFNQIKFIYTTIFQELSNKFEGYLDVVENNLNTLLIYFSRLKLNITDSTQTKYSDLVYNIKSIIDTYYYQEIKLDDLAKRLSDSKSSICHIFKKETGQSIIEYKLNKQLEEGANLLKISDMTISQIGSMIGFNTTSYFISQFKKKYSLSPREYKLRNN